jgi:CPA1 family monovalent cation:H+ antiporter
MSGTTAIEMGITVFAALMLVAQLLAIRLRIPYTLVLVFIGIAITAVSALSLGAGPIAGSLVGAITLIRSIYGQLVDNGIFVGLIVPPLIFEAMMHIKRSELAAVIRPSLVLATVGVLLSTVVAGLVVWELSGISLYSAMLFAAIIAPTDTITVLQIFRRVKVPPKLATLMDMEAAFNDATAIVLFTIILSSAGLAGASLLNDVDVFLYSFVGGVIIGVIVAVLARKIHMSVDDKLAELTLTIVAVYGSYVLATGVGASGLIAVAIVGLYFGNSTKMALSRKVRSSIASFWEIAAFIGNAVAFLLIGFDSNLSLFVKAGALILVAYGSTLLARMVTVYPIFAVFSRVEKRLSMDWSNIATLGGVRGALSIALLATLASSNVLSDGDLSTVTTMVLGVVFISIIIQVPLLSRYASRQFGRRSKPEDSQ